MRAAQSLPHFAALNAGYRQATSRCLLLLKFNPLVGMLEIHMERLAQAV
jgi:hypothetical protein